jgi:hypothetical protein
MASRRLSSLPLAAQGLVRGIAFRGASPNVSSVDWGAHRRKRAVEFDIEPNADRAAEISVRHVVTISSSHP